MHGPASRNGIRHALCRRGEGSAGEREQALARHPVAPDDRAEGGDQPQPIGLDTAHEVPQPGSPGGSVRAELSVGQLRNQPRPAGRGCVSDCRHRAELALDALHRGSKAGWIGHVGDLEGDTDAGRAQPFESVHRSAVLVRAVAADDGDCRPAAGEHLRERQPGAGRAAADQDDVCRAEREHLAPGHVRGHHDRLERQASAVDPQLAELAGRGGGIPAGGPQPVSALGYPQQRDAQRRILGVQAGKEPGEAGAVADHDELAGAERVPRRGQCRGARLGVVRVAEDGQGTAGAGLIGEELISKPAQRMVRGNRDPPGPVVPGADVMAGRLQLLGEAACPRPDPGDRIAVRGGLVTGARRRPGGP